MVPFWWSPLQGR